MRAKSAIELALTLLECLGRRVAHLGGIVGGPAQHRTRTDDVTRDVQRQIVLSQVQDVGGDRARDVGPVVHREQRAMAAGRVGKDLQCGDFLTGFQRAEALLAGRALVAELDDVHAAGQRGVGELGEVAALPAGVGAQVEPGGGQPIQWKRFRALHEPRVAGCVGWTGHHGSPANRAESGPGAGGPDRRT